MVFLNDNVGSFNGILKIVYNICLAHLEHNAGFSKFLHNLLA